MDPPHLKCVGPLPCEILMAAFWIPTATESKTQQTVVRKHNKPRSRVAHRGLARFLGIDKNVTRSSRGHSTPSLKISWQPFSRNLADKETKIQRYKQTNKQIDRNSFSDVLRAVIYTDSNNFVTYVIRVGRRRSCTPRRESFVICCVASISATSSLLLQGATNF